MTSAQSKRLLQQAVPLQRAGRLEEATALYRRAWALSPGDPLCGRALAHGLCSGGWYAAAEKLLRSLAQRHPKDGQLLDDWAIALQRCGRMEESLAASRHSVAADPASVRAWLNYGLALLNTGHPAEALKCQDRALSLDRGHAGAHHGRAMSLQHLHRIAEAVTAYGEAIERDPRNFETRSYRLFALHYLSGVPRDALWEEHQAFGAAAPQPGECEPQDPDPDRRLKIAFLSPDLREHSVAYFLEPLLRHLDPKQFDIVLYHDHYNVDAVSDRLRRWGGVWRNLIGLSHDRAAEWVRGDAPDILVDLAGHTGMNRLPMLASRLAPVQITYLGYPDTTGVPAIDYRLVDDITDPVGEADRFCSERLLRFAPTAWSYLPAAEAPVPLSAADRGARPPVFGSCNNLAKVTCETLRGWAGALRAVPNARLLVKSPGLSDPTVAAEFRIRAAAAGIDPSRLETAGRIQGLKSHLSFYHRIDVALDTFPYHGTTTTCEALWMGVPVVSLQGDRHCARVGGSLLRAIGRPEWTARTWEEFAGVVARLAGNLPDRQGVRERMKTSVLMDHAGQAARFGAALRQCWRERVTRSPAKVAA